MDFSEIAKSTTKGLQAHKTDRYCAPEVAGGRERGRRSDVYSLGCLFVEVMTVVMGFPLQSLDKELGGDCIFHESAIQVDSWLSKLGKEADATEAMLLNWLPPLLRKAPGSRPLMQKVISVILEDTKAHRDIRTQIFCASCTNEMRDQKLISTPVVALSGLKLQDDSDYGSGKRQLVERLRKDLYESRIRE